MSTYVKFINLFPEIKGHIQEVSQFLYTILLAQNCKAITPELGNMLSYINYIYMCVCVICENFFIC